MEPQLLVLTDDDGPPHGRLSRVGLELREDGLRRDLLVVVIDDLGLSGGYHLVHGHPDARGHVPPDVDVARPELHSETPARQGGETDHGGHREHDVVKAAASHGKPPVVHDPSVVPHLGEELDVHFTATVRGAVKVGARESVKVVDGELHLEVFSPRAA